MKPAAAFGQCVDENPGGRDANLSLARNSWN
jgi:hypothetical protein